MVTPELAGGFPSRMPFDMVIRFSTCISRLCQCPAPLIVQSFLPEHFLLNAKHDGRFSFVTKSPVWDTLHCHPYTGQWSGW